MRFSVVLSGLFAAMAVAETTASAPATAVSLSPAQASVQACYNACAKGDVDCQAHCVAVPSPNGSQVNATTQCVAACPQGNGSAADTKAYADCTQKCINAHYFVTSKGTPEATGAAGGDNAANSNTDTAAAPTGTGSSGSSGTETGAAPTGSSATKSSKGSSTKTGSAATSSTTNAAPAIIASGGAFVGVVAALLAL